MALIYSRNSDNTVLTLDEIRTRAPAVFAETKAEHLTDRYAQLKTADFIPVLADYGYEVTQAAQSRKKSKAGLEHKHHFVAFTNMKDEGVNGVRPEIILFNSHEGSSAVKLFSGAFRFICSNQIIRGEGSQSKLYHNTSSIARFENLLQDTIQRLPETLTRVEQMKQISADAFDVNSLAKKAFLTRWNENQFSEEYTIDSMLNVRRMEDAKNDFWTIWNRLQESTLRNGTSIQRVQPDGSVKIRTACAISNPKEHIRINSDLWDIATEVLGTV